MLTELSIGNFKAFGETQRIPIKPLTLIFGANSSGKSSIIHSLLLMNHSSETGNFDVRIPRMAESAVDLGGFRSYVHGHDAGRSVDQYIEIAINSERLQDGMVGANEGEKAAFSGFSRFGLKLTCGLRRSDSAVADLRQIQVHVDGQPLLLFELTDAGSYQAVVMHGCLDCLLHVVRQSLALIAWEAQKPPFDYYPLVTNPTEAERQEQKRRREEYERAKREYLASYAPSETELAEFRTAFAEVMAEDTYGLKGIVLRDPRPEGLRTWPAGMGQLLSGDHGGVADAFHELGGLIGADSPLRAEAHALRFNLSSLVQCCSSGLSEVIIGMRYLGPLREVPSRYFTETVGEEKANWTSAHSWWRLARDKALVADVNRWLRDALQTRYACQMRQLLDDTGFERGVFPEFLDTHSKISFSHRDLGFGMSQVLPVLVEAAANRGRLISVEQPELHLHPAQQAELGDVFIESALGDRKNMFLLETHSEHLILRILRRVRETTEKKLPAGAIPVRPDDVTVVFVDPTPSGSVIRHLRVTPDGDFAEPWPGGFFAERLKDLPS